MAVALLALVIVALAVAGVKVRSTRAFERAAVRAEGAEHDAGEAPGEVGDRIQVLYPPTIPGGSA